MHRDEMARVPLHKYGFRSKHKLIVLFTIVNPVAGFLLWYLRLRLLRKCSNRTELLRVERQMSTLSFFGTITTFFMMTLMCLFLAITVRADHKSRVPNQQQPLFTPSVQMSERMQAHFESLTPARVTKTKTESVPLKLEADGDMHNILEGKTCGLNITSILDRWCEFRHNTSTFSVP
ncbi:Hypothetical predicted protein [Mytilus galloprovincialis]|uniref:Uncharacterized protein n=1 Tax=Mytilus galloprovincialis TaxID=29158 RepID=A0A8B6E0U8_MYTGA|nr:Hypothetical predicted protein [Mytilus galloprovincialis]